MFRKKVAEDKSNIPWWRMVKNSEPFLFHASGKRSLAFFLKKLEIWWMYAYDDDSSDEYVLKWKTFLLNDFEITFSLRIYSMSICHEYRSLNDRNFRNRIVSFVIHASLFVRIFGLPHNKSINGKAFILEFKFIHFLLYLPHNVRNVLWHLNVPRVVCLLR